MSHTESDGRPKIVPRCTLPLTAQGAVDLIITNLAVFDFSAGGLRLIELMPGATLDAVRAATSAPFTVALP
jgi:3-oxoacid CoA-transferase